MLAAALGVVACGGEDEKEDVQELLDRAFQRPLESMDIELEAEIAVEGLEDVDKPIRIRASGPYRAAKGKLPSFDIDLDLSAGGPGSTISTGRLSTGDRTFVRFGDSFYEVEPEEVDAANRELRGGPGGSCTRRGIGIDARSWIGDAEDEGDEKVGGVNTTHVSGRLRVAGMLRELNGFLGRCGALLGTAAAGEIPKALSERDLDKVAQVVEDPRFDVYVGKEDDIIRRISASIDLKVPEEDRESVNGLESGSVRFSIEFADVNGDQVIEAPATSRPLSELTSQLGADALNGGLGLDGGPDSRTPQNYADCLDSIDPDDTEALDRCSALLNAP